MKKLKRPNSLFLQGKNSSYSTQQSVEIWEISNLTFQHLRAVLSEKFFPCKNKEFGHLNFFINLFVFPILISPYRTTLYKNIHSFRLMSIGHFYASKCSIDLKPKHMFHSINFLLCFQDIYMVKCSCQYQKARKYIHIFKTYWRTSSCAVEFWMVQN